MYYYLYVGIVLHCISSSARKKTFTFTTASAPFSQLTPRKKQTLQAIPKVHDKTLLISCKEIRKRTIFITVFK